jgi:hypothetical protein
MNDPSVRKQKSGDQLAPGDWLAPGELLDGAAEVLHALAYRPSENFRENEKHVHLVVRGQGNVAPYADVVAGGTLFDLATEADLAELREQAERAERIADIRALADWLEANSWVPLPYIAHAYDHLTAPRDVPTEAAGLAKVRGLAERLGLKTDESLDDRTKLVVPFGEHASYELVTWHKDGRPAEPEPEPEPEREGPWFNVGDRVVPRGWEKSQYARAGLNVIATVVETKPITGSPRRRQQFRAEGADWCGGGSMWNHSDGFELAPDADPTGLSYTRADEEADDPTPVSGGRIPPHTGAVTDGGLVDETPVEPVDEHYEARGWKGEGPGECGVECACGEAAFDGFDSLYEAKVQLSFHIEAATSPTGLTKAADQSRGVLAFTTPVVTYFSFGHGQTDPDTGESLLDHYVTVVAPTYEACREAMFASRFGNRWSFDYLAGTAKATDAVSRWTEHEVIVAAGTDPAASETALKAARELLAADETATEAR